MPKTMSQVPGACCPRSPLCISTGDAAELCSFVLHQDPARGQLSAALGSPGRRSPAACGRQRHHCLHPRTPLTFLDLLVEVDGVHGGGDDVGLAVSGGHDPGDLVHQLHGDPCGRKAELWLPGPVPMATSTSPGLRIRELEGLFWSLKTTKPGRLPLRSLSVPAKQRDLFPWLHSPMPPACPACWCTAQDPRPARGSSPLARPPLTAPGGAASPRKLLLQIAVISTLGIYNLRFAI